MAKKLKAKKAAAIVVATTKEKLAAAQLMEAAELIEGLQSDFFGMVRTAITDGCTFAGMEEACPELKAIGAYRSAKSVISAAKKQGVALVDGEGQPRGKSAINAELKPTNAKGKGRAKKGKAKSIKADKVSQVTAALAILKADPSMRKAFAAELRDLSLSDEVRDFEQRRTRSMGAHPKARTAALTAAVKQAQAAAAPKTGTNG
jgi:hypothetical protein